MSSYKEEIIGAMKWLAEDERVLFIGQSVLHPDVTAIYETLKDIPPSKRVELPVAEQMQMGISIGLSLEGFVPCSIYPRFDFLILATDALVNHLDKVEQMSCGRFKPKVIIRTCVGSKIPLNPGPQHYQDHTRALRLLLTNIDVIQLENQEDILPVYKSALKSQNSTILVELSEKYY